MTEIKTLSVAELKKLGACQDGLVGFEALFGVGEVEVTRENCLKAIQLFRETSSSGFDWANGVFGLSKADQRYARALSDRLSEYNNAWQIAHEKMNKYGREVDRGEFVNTAISLYENYCNDVAILFYEAWKARFGVPQAEALGDINK